MTTPTVARVDDGRVDDGRVDDGTELAIETSGLTKRFGAQTAVDAVDLAVPRDIHPTSREVPGVSLYDMDDLQTLVERNVSGREAEVLPPPHGMDPAALQVPVPELEDWGPGYALVVSRLLPYKNVDAVIEAASAVSMPSAIPSTSRAGPSRMAEPAGSGPGISLRGDRISAFPAPSGLRNVRCRVTGFPSPLRTKATIAGRMPPSPSLILGANRRSSGTATAIPRLPR